MTNDDLNTEALSRLVAALSTLDGVEAMSLGGSWQAGLADEHSDLDVHVYWRPPLAEGEERAARLAPLADAASLRVGIQSWGLEDHLAIEGVLVELIYFRFDELAEQVERAYREGLDSEAFTTAFLYTVAHGQPLHDPSGDLASLRERLQSDFPEATFQVVLARRAPLLRVSLKLMRRAQERGDLLSVQQLRASFQAIYFNLLFTLNRRYHPGEKRLLIHSEQCPLRPALLTERWNASARMPADAPALPDLLEGLALDLHQLIEEKGGVRVQSESW